MVAITAAAFCVNRLMIGAMSVALDSLVRSTPSLRRTYVLHDGLSESCCESLGRRFGSKEICFRRLDLTAFKGLRSLHGDYTTYGKLLIPELIASDERLVLYLDADLVVLADIGSVVKNIDSGPCLFAVNAGKAETSLDWSLYRDCGMDPTQLVFNAGVLMFDCPAFRKYGMKERALEIARRHAGRLLSADQAVFNVLFSRDRGCLPRTLNIGVTPATPRISELAEGVYHFVGSPKPWDLFGPFLHPNYPVFHRAMKAAGMGLWQVRGAVSVRQILRTIRIGRSP